MSKERLRISIKYNIKKEILRQFFLVHIKNQLFVFSCFERRLGKSRLTFDSARNNPATRFEPKK